MEIEGLYSEEKIYSILRENDSLINVALGVNQPKDIISLEQFKTLWSSTLEEMKMDEIFFHLMLSILSEICVPFPQSNKNNSPSLLTNAEVRNLPGRGIIPLVPSTNTSKFIPSLLYRGFILVATVPKHLFSLFVLVRKGPLQQK